jgi:hypothetical protein
MVIRGWTQLDLSDVHIPMAGGYIEFDERNQGGLSRSEVVLRSVPFLTLHD